MPMPPPPHATQVCCPEYLDRLLAEGHEREYCVLEAVGMGFLAEDMDGWTQEYRTFCIELVRALLAYNILGDQLYLLFSRKMPFICPHPDGPRGHQHAFVRLSVPKT